VRLPDGEVTAPADVGDGRRRSSRDPGYQSVAVAPKVRQLRDTDPEELRTLLKTGRDQDDHLRHG